MLYKRAPNETQVFVHPPAKTGEFYYPVCEAHGG